MHGAQEASDQSCIGEIGQGIAADAVMGVKDIEHAVARDAKPVPIFADSLLNHVGR